MFIYILISLFLFLFAVLNFFVPKDFKSINIKVFLLLEFLVLFLFVGIRKDVGVDYPHYQDLYNLSPNLDKMKEGGFILMIKFFRYLGLSFNFFCLFYGFLTVFLAFKFFYKYSPFVLFSILIYFCIGNFYFSSFNAMRQALATVIFFNTFKYIVERKFLKYIFVLLLTAYFVHATVVILIPLYFILNKVLKTYLKIILFVCVIIFGSIAITIIKLSPYAIYLKFDYFASSVPLTYYIIGLLAFIIFIYSLINSAWAKKHLILVNLNFLAILLLALLFINNHTPLVMVFNRLLGYFTLIYVVLLPLWLAKLKTTNSKVIIIFLISCILVSVLGWTLLNNGTKNQMVPYNSIFNEY